MGRQSFLLPFLLYTEWPHLKRSQGIVKKGELKKAVISFIPKSPLVALMHLYSVSSCNTVPGERERERDIFGQKSAFFLTVLEAKHREFSTSSLTM